MQPKITRSLKMRVSSSTFLTSMPVADLRALRFLSFLLKSKRSLGFLRLLKNTELTCVT